MDHDESGLAQFRIVEGWLKQQRIPSGRAVVTAGAKEYVNVDC
jgi:hypothetical protein